MYSASNKVNFLLSLLVSAFFARNSIYILAKQLVELDPPDNVSHMTLPIIRWHKIKYYVIELFHSLGFLPGRYAVPLFAT